MAVITAVRPMSQPKVLPVRADLDITTDPRIKALGGLVIAAVAVFIVIFW